MGGGLSALLHGTSGTGKTLAARIIAHWLDMDLYKVNLAAVVNKYIDETEKNTHRIARSPALAAGRSKKKTWAQAAIPRGNTASSQDGLRGLAHHATPTAGAVRL